MTFGIAVIFWRESSAPFIRASEESSDSNYAGFYLAIALDFVKAIAIGFSASRRIPIGVYLHGVFLIVTAVLLFIGWSLE